jgi:2-polyprenyl-6-methoxyphenol hydroxylase-like FAD-dependent oxidoreductase
MTHVIVLGAGLNGLSTAMLLARDGHRVTVLEHDEPEPPVPDAAWETWRRRGVNQFHLPHFMLPRWRALMGEELPEVLDELRAAGGLTLNLLEMLPASRRGPMRPGDERFETVTARRPVLEAAVAAVAARTAGVEIRRGVTVTGVTMDRSHVTGVRTGDRTVTADLVVDCGGRRSALGSWLVAAGARAPVEEREHCGFVYYGRHFRGRMPEALTHNLQNYESVSLLTLPADNDTWSVVVTASSRDKAIRGLRDPTTWDAVVSRYPMAAHWCDGDPITGVDVMAGIEDRYRRLVVDGEPVATGVVAVGDAWACTNPSLGRGTSIGLLHARCLRDVLRETGTDDSGKLVRRFDEVTAEIAEPLYRTTLWYDRHRLAEMAAEIAGEPYLTDDVRWHASRATVAAALRDADITRAHVSLASLIATPTELYAQPGVLDRIMRLGGDAPRFPLPGPSRRELLSAF